MGYGCSIQEHTPRTSRFDGHHRALCPHLGSLLAIPAPRKHIITIKALWDTDIVNDFIVLEDFFKGWRITFAVATIPPEASLAQLVLELRRVAARTMTTSETCTGRETNFGPSGALGKNAVGVGIVDTDGSEGDALLSAAVAVVAGVFVVEPARVTDEI